MITDPDTVEPDLFGGDCDRHLLAPAHLAFDLGELDADLHSVHVCEVSDALIESSDRTVERSNACG